VERAYTCLLLVETNYSPSTYSIKFLRSLAEQIDPNLITAWPRETKHDRRLFELLKRGYIDARYSELVIVPTVFGLIATLVFGGANVAI